MSEIATLIADMVRRGVDPDIIGRTAELLCRNESNVTVRNALSNAERQKRYRERKRENNNSNETVTKSNVTDVTQKEKNKKKKNQKEKIKNKNIYNPPLSPQDELPDWLDRGVWEDFKNHRKQNKAKLTPRAEKLILGKLERWRSTGSDPTEVLNLSIENGWKGIFEIKRQGNGKNETNRTNSKGFSRKSAGDALDDAFNEYFGGEDEQGNGASIERPVKAVLQHF